MGDTRNAGKEERKKKKTGDGFKEDSVCKYHLVGFCPEHEDLFHNTKRDLGECNKTHFSISKDEFDKHPEKERYRIEYERKLLRHLEAICRRCDDWTAKEKAKNEAASQKAMDAGGNDVARAEISKLNEEIGKLLAEAEDYASEGNVMFSREKVEQAECLKRKAEDWEGKARALPEVCEVCGVTKENDQGGINKFSHSMGKVHLGYTLIRKWLSDLKAKEEKRIDDKQEAREERERRSEERGGIEKIKKGHYDKEDKEADEADGAKKEGSLEGDGGRKNAEEGNDKDGGAEAPEQKRERDGGKEADGDDGRKKRRRDDNDADRPAERSGGRRGENENGDRAADRAGGRRREDDDTDRNAGGRSDRGCDRDRGGDRGGGDRGGGDRGGGGRRREGYDTDRNDERSGGRRRDDVDDDRYGDRGGGRRRQEDDDRYADRNSGRRRQDDDDRYEGGRSRRRP